MHPPCCCSARSGRPPTSGGRKSSRCPNAIGSFGWTRADTASRRRPPGLSALDDLGADALSVLDAAGVERVAVCGVSLGGMTAMWLAAHVPDRVRSLVAVSTGLKIGARSMWEERIRQVRAGGTESIADASMGRWFTERFRGAHPDVVAWCRAMLTGCPTDGYISCCGALMDADLHAAAQRIVAPDDRDRRPRGSGHTTGECAGNRRPHRRRAAPDAGCLAYLRRRTAAGIQRRGAHVSRS